MKIRIVRNKYLNALLVTILFSAVFHIVILFSWFVYRLDYYVLNYFNILDFDLFIPGFAASSVGTILSWVVFIGFYLIILRKNKTDDV